MTIDHFILFLNTLIIIYINQRIWDPEKSVKINTNFGGVKEERLMKKNTYLLFDDIIIIYDSLRISKNMFFEFSNY